MKPEDDDKWYKAFKYALHQSEEEYLKEIKDKKWAKNIADDVIKAQHTQNLIRDILESVPLGVGQRNVFDALIVAWLFGFAPENFQEIGVNVANQILPLRMLRNPMFQFLGDSWLNPSTIGYNKLHTERLKYERKQKKDKEQLEKNNMLKPPPIKMNKPPKIKN